VMFHPEISYREALKTRRGELNFRQAP